MNREFPQPTEDFNTIITRLERYFENVDVKGYIKLGSRKDGAKIHFARDVFPDDFNFDFRNVADEKERAEERRVIDIGLKFLICQGEELYEGDLVEFEMQDQCSECDASSYILINDSIQPLLRQGSDYFVPHRELAYPTYRLGYWEEAAHRSSQWWIDLRLVKMRVDKFKMIIDEKYHLSWAEATVDALEDHADFLEVKMQSDRWDLWDAFCMLCQRHDARTIPVEFLDGERGKELVVASLFDDFKPTTIWDHLLVCLLKHHESLTVVKFHSSFLYPGIEGLQMSYKMFTDIRDEIEEEVVIFFSQTKFPCNVRCKELVNSRKDQTKSCLTGILPPLANIILSYIY